MAFIGKREGRIDSRAYNFEGLLGQEAATKNLLDRVPHGVDLMWLCLGRREEEEVRLEDVYRLPTSAAYENNAHYSAFNLLLIHYAFVWGLGSSEGLTIVT